MTKRRPGTLASLLTLVVLGAGGAGCAEYYGFSFPAGGVAFTRGNEGRATRASGALVTYEAGKVSDGGRALAFETRGLDVFWLPTEDLRLRFALVTLGARFTAFAIWSTGWRSTGVVTGDATFYYFHRGPDIRVSYEVFGAGLFARGSFLNWNVDFADENGDLRSVYAPLAEGGIWLRGTIPTMLGPGVDIMFGGAVDHDTGGIGFLRIEMFFGQHVDCHGRRRSCRTGN